MDHNAGQERMLCVWFPADIWRTLSNAARDVGVPESVYVELCLLAGLAHQCYANGQPAHGNRVSRYAQELAVAVGGRICTRAGRPKP